MYKKNILFVFIIANILLHIPVYGSENVVINEIYFDLENSKNNWIEIYNSSNECIILKSFFASNIRTPNQLPIQVKRKGGLLINPSEYIILCVDIEQFISNWKTNNDLKIIDGLYFLNSGYIEVTIENNKKSIITEKITYGTIDHQINIENIKNNENMSFSRIISKSNDNFYISIPSPGVKNK